MNSMIKEITIYVEEEYNGLLCPLLSVLNGIQETKKKILFPDDNLKYY